jgi:formylglycine-generating enzyme required for sulfatase activity
MLNRKILARAAVVLALQLAMAAPASVAARQEALAGIAALRMAVKDIGSCFPGRYPRGPEWLQKLDYLEANAQDVSGTNLASLTAELAKLRRESLLANPLLDFDRMLVVKRKADRLALPQNWESNSTLPRGGLDNEITVLSGLRGKVELRPFYRPEGGKFVGDLAMHYDAKRFMFSSLGTNNRWAVFEMNVAGGTPSQLPLIPDGDVDNYTSCYLPDDSIIFSSTAPFIGVPCVRGSSHVANFYRYWPVTGKIRRLTFDQEHNWCPTVMADGRVLYLRWEYSDLPHYVARILFTMNPDGTNQREFYGSGSYWPNAFFYAKQMPGHPTQVAGIVGGHHGVPRMGELVIMDPSRGRFEADGVVQRIPGYGKKVEPVILDNLVDDSWPKFLHPVPLSDNYIITACKPTPASAWGIYLVDVFDNMVLVKEEPGYALLEPTPLQTTQRPPMIPDAVREGEKTARMQIADIYQGPGLQGVPRGTIKRLRLFTYNYSYQNIGGQVDRVGIDGPWDIKRIIGTVPVEADGSVSFEVPANLPISLQPLDGQGRAVALMRSWTTAMPGEIQSCVGCHEKQNSASVINGSGLAMRKPPAMIEPFYGPMRGFHFDREVQPVLDRHCIVCHDGQARSDGRIIPDFRRGPLVFAGEKEVKFPPAYVALKSYVRTPTAENDMHLLLPYEFHASTTELVQRLEAGHHGVRLDAESWDRLNTWIDLNTPAWGTWEEMVGRARLGQQRERRRELTLRYAGTDDDTDAVYPAPDWRPNPAPAISQGPVAEKPLCEAWPFDANEARRRQQGTGPATMSLDLGDGVSLALVRIPAGRFVAGGSGSSARTVQILRPFWMSACEIGNEQYARFNPRHDSRIEHGDFLQFSVQGRGRPLSDPKQPVCHVSWEEAQAFCRWLAERSGSKVCLPSGDAWEYACRAGAATPMGYGETDADFSRQANLADVNLRNPTGHRCPVVPEWRPAVTNVNDGRWVSSPVGSYLPNSWGLFDMHGNVWEWTTDLAGDGVRRFARGGSWYVRPQRATADTTVAYLPWQKVYDVGFRIMIEEQLTAKNISP